MKKIAKDDTVDVVTIKETAHILRISPKTIYNKLWKKRFPLRPFRLPWNKRDLYFHLSEVNAMAKMRAEPTRNNLHNLLCFIPPPAEPVSVALYGSPPEADETTVGSRMLTITPVRADQLPSWRKTFDLLWIKRNHPALCLAGSSAECYAAAAFLSRLAAERKRWSG